jgi:DNA-binding transcriptional LysR family regulator
MDIHLLTAFVTVAELGSFSAAALRLHLTQSAISKRIALLEGQVTQPLFDRIGRSVQLTEAGLALVPRAKGILQEIADTKQFISDMRGRVSGPLRIATSHHIGLHRIPSILKTFNEQYPDVHLQLTFIDSEQAINAILQGEFELALITLPKTILDDTVDNIQHHKLWQDPMEFVVNNHHPLSLKYKIRLDDLAAYPAILPDRNTYTTDLIHQLFAQEKQLLNISMTTNHLDAIKMMISVGLGWSVLPRTLMSEHLTRLNVSDLKLTRQLGCIHHRGRTLSNAARTMLKHLR